MSKIMYKARAWYRPEILTVSIDGETEHFVKIGNRREKKRTDDTSFFETFEEAKAWLLEIFESRAKIARRNLEEANSYLGNVKGMKERKSEGAAK